MNHEPNKLDDVRGRFSFWRPNTRMNGTYTHAQRNQQSLTTAVASLKDISTDAQTIQVLEIGPGAVIDPSVLKTGEGHRLRRKLESAIRKLPIPNSLYACYESRELIQALDAQGLAFELTVIDRSERVLDIAGRTLSDSCPDLVRSPLSRHHPVLNDRFNLIVCCNVMYHMPNADDWRRSRDNLISYCAPSCVVVCDDRRIFLQTDFERIADHVFLRRASR